MSDSFTTLRTEREGPVLSVTLDRPDVLNALNATMFDDLERAFTAVAHDSSLRAVLLTGAGERAFAAGADIRGLVEKDTHSGRALSERGHHVFNLIERCGKPVIASINGVALGGGCELALACTLRLAADNARLGFPEVKLGLIPGYGGTQRLPRLIGRAHALRLLLTGEPVAAEEARRIGLVDEVVPAAALPVRARELAAQIAALAPLAVAAILETLDRTDAQGFDRGLALEAEIFARLCGTTDKAEGLDAFLAKRAPVWTGR